MGFWKDHMPAGLLLRSASDWHLDPTGVHTIDRFRGIRGPGSPDGSTASPLTLQFYPHASYMLELDWAPLVGAVIVTRKAWDAMTPAGRDALTKAGADMSVQLRALSRREHQESVEAMTKRGLKVQKLTPELDAEWRRAAEAMYPLVRGHMVPADFFDEVQRLVREYRAGQGGTR